MKRLLLLLLLSISPLIFDVKDASAAIMECKVNNTPPTTGSGSTSPVYCDTTGHVITSTATGGATEAKQDTIIGHIDGIEGSLTSILSSVDGLEGFVDGLETLVTSLRSTIGAAIGTTAVLMGASDGANLQALKVDGSGNLNVNIAAGAAAGGTSSAFNAAIPANGTAVGASDGANMKPLLVDGSGFLKVNISAGAAAGGTSATDDGAFTAAAGAGTPIMGFATADTVDSGDVGVLAMDTARNLKVVLQAGSAAVGTVGVTSISAGNNNIGDVDVASIAAGNNNIGDVDVASIAAGDNNIGNVDIVTMPAVNVAAATTGGCTPAKTLSAATTNSTNVKGSAGTLCSLNVINTTGTKYYLKFYDKATAPTCNSDTVIQSIPIPASTDGAGIAANLGPFGWAFTTGIGFCLTGAIADNDNTNAATGVAVNYSYK